jgi:Cu+-exporting ATPase
VRRVEQALSELEGVSRAEINLATEKATIEYDAQLVSPERIGEKLAEAGYQALDLEPALDSVRAKTTLSLGGMTCTACAPSGGGVEWHSGVWEAAVNRDIQGDSDTR